MYDGVFRVKALYPKANGLGETEIYGYYSKGLPGVEIVGLGAQGRSIKEKLIFFSRQLGVKIPMKRYVLCIDLPADLRKDRQEETSRWLELPLLILFWTLSGCLELKNLSNCMTIGKVQVNGTILCPEIENLGFESSREDKLIMPSFINLPGEGYLIPLEELFRDIGNGQIKYKQIISAC